MIEFRYGQREDWKLYTDIVLSEIYKLNLKWLSAEGKRGTQGIHSGVLKGLISKCDVAFAST